MIGPVLFLIAAAAPLLAQDAPPVEKEAATAPIPLIALFTPPQGWQTAHSPSVQIAFVGKGASQYRPSISLATEEIDVSLKQYVKDVKEIHLRDRGTTWRDLGKFSMKAGEGRLTELTTSSHWGEVKMYQAIFVHGQMAYILTAASSKKDAPLLQKEFLQAMQSFSLEPDLTAFLQGDAAKNRFREVLSSLGQFDPGKDRAAQQKKQWELLQKTIKEDFQDMGGHWHFLALQEAHAKVYGSTK